MNEAELIEEVDLPETTKENGMKRQICLRDLAELLEEAHLPERI